ncbi:MAG: hypothetical protein V3V41_10730 [Candidatus Heimdallarchaeota archaeon]
MSKFKVYPAIRAWASTLKGDIYEYTENGEWIKLLPTPYEIKGEVANVTKN